jgi:hypothetical protein
VKQIGEEIKEAGVSQEPERPWRTLATRYLMAQGLVVLLFWLVMFFRPELRSTLWPSGMRREGFDAFAAPDLLLLAAGSLAAASGLERERWWGWPTLLFVAGAGAYAGIYTISLSVLTNQAWTAALLMLPVTIVPPVLAWKVRRC